jgi:hypothetical protein
MSEGIRAFDACGKSSKRIKWDKLLVKDFKSPFLVNLRGTKHYNKLLTKAEMITGDKYYDKDKAKWEMKAYKPITDDDGGWFGECLNNFIEAMCEYLADGGVVPGLTIVQIPRGDTWDQFAADGVCASPITSGYGTASRAAFLSWTDGKYKDSFIYPATSNCLHEVGHVLGLCHQFAGGGYIDSAHQKAIETPFKKPEGEDCVCVMSYSGCYGDFCGKCLLSLRGWKTHTMAESVQVRKKMEEAAAEAAKEK